MRLVVTGVGADGRSTVLRVEEAQFVPSPAERVPTGRCASARLWLHEGGPLDTVGGAPDAEYAEFNLAPGAAKWVAVDYGRGVTSVMHRTVSLDYDVIVAGEIDLVLEDGEIHLVAGDAVLIPGVAHQWRTGESECTLVSVLLGLPHDSR